MNFINPVPIADCQGTQESAEKRKQKKKNGISFKREDEKEELMNWSPLQEVVEKLPTFTAGA